MKKNYAILILILASIFTFFMGGWLTWIFPVWFLCAILVMVFGVETGPDSWAWSWTIKKDKT
jgi:NADH:ubiquinone oxidoreductase subunit H